CPSDFPLRASRRSPRRLQESACAAGSSRCCRSRRGCTWDPPSSSSPMHILECEHRNESLFTSIVEPARARELARILVRSEQHIPPDEVAVVVSVASVLVMDAMHFRTLENQSNPSPGPDVRVIEKFAECRECGVDRSGTQIEPQQRVDDQRSENGVHDHFQRMLVERRDHLDPLRTVMDLVKHAPEKVGFVTPSMPPVKNEGRDEVGDESSRDRRNVRGKREQRPPREPLLP